ncbi:MAG: saccharopine dehydrogenase family protein [Euzebya sp.]
MSSRTYDLIIYGATGFTGRLVAEYLTGAAPDGLRWALAGRSRERLADVAREIGQADLPLVIADSSDPQSLGQMAMSAQVVCTTVGPYATHGTPVVQACIEAGTDYCDLTGEVQWIRQMIDTYQEQAAQSGARIVHTCGFDSIPSDLGTLYAQQQMMQRHGVFASHVKMRVKALRGGASGGTIASLMNVMAEAANDPSVRRIVTDPYALNPAGQRQGPDTNESLRPVFDPDFDQWVGPFVMAVINSRVVRRTNALLNHSWGQNFRYDEGMLMGSGPLGAVKAAGLGAGVGGGAAMMAVGPVRNLVGRVLPGSGSGPGPAARQKGFFDIRLAALHPTDSNRNVMVKVTGDADPGYGSTCKMLGQSALALAAGEATVAGGVWTPATALGEPLLERLPRHAGVTFEVLG